MPPTQVAHYAAVLLGTSAVLWMCRVITGRHALLAVGFCVAVHPGQPDTIWVFPIGGGDNRFPPGGKCRVWRSTDAGDSWEELGEGLPDRFHVAVMRDAMCVDDHEQPGLYFGARNGSVFASVDGGGSWNEIVRDLPDVMMVRAASVP